MKFNFLKVLTFASACAGMFGLVACDNGNSGANPDPDEEVSSSSDVISGSSSSVIPGGDPGSPSSSSKTKSSSSSKSKSSSSVKSSSSSVVSSSSSAKSSSSNEKKIAWDYLNPDIDYGEFTDKRDGHIYKTVTIGTQTWMAENLNYAYTGVPYKYSSYTSDSTSWCYDNKASNCEKYGRLYTWSAVMDSAAKFSENAGTKCGFGTTCTPNSPHRGICPEGWHVPTNEEYSTLYNNIGGSSTAGTKLKSTSGWYNGGNGTDDYGFSVLPAGSRSNGGEFYIEGRYADLWSATEYNSSRAWYPNFSYDDDYADQYYYGKYYGQSLRCLKD